MYKERCSICGNYNKDESGNYKHLNARYKCCDKCQEEADKFTEEVRFFVSGDWRSMPCLPTQLLMHSPLFAFRLKKFENNYGYNLYNLLFNILRNVQFANRRWINEDDLWDAAPGDVEPEEVRCFFEFAIKTKLIKELKPFSERYLERVLDKNDYLYDDRRKHYTKQRYSLDVKRLYNDEFVNNLFPITCNPRFEKGTSIARMLWIDFAISYERIYNNLPEREIKK